MPASDPTQTTAQAPASATDGRKPCTLCSRPCNVRIRCQIDASGKWHLLCPGRCWKSVSGGIVDGDGNEGHEFYRYGGVWKNKKEGVSGKKKKGRGRGKDDGGEEGGGEGREGGRVVSWRDGGVKYSKGDRVRLDDGDGEGDGGGEGGGIEERRAKVWIAKRSHASEDGKRPGLWDEGWEQCQTSDVEADTGGESREQKGAMKQST
jgi:hypothetical protein